MQPEGWALTICSVVTAVVGMLSARDKLRYDAEMQSLKAKDQQQTAQIVALTNQNGQQAVQIKALQEDHKNCNEKLDECNEKHAQSAEVQSSQGSAIAINKQRIDELEAKLTALTKKQ